MRNVGVRLRRDRYSDNSRQTVEQQTRELHKLPEAGNIVDTIV
jgi:hypothetical protein